MSDKTTIRSQIKETILQLPESVREAEDRATCVSLRRIERWKSAQMVLAYDALPDEAATDCLIAAARTAGKRVFLPRITGKAIAFLPHRSPESDVLILHPFGMREPADGVPWASGDGDTVVLVPGRAFARSGARLGRGGGFYDRFLSALSPVARSRTVLVGLCYSVQLFETLPAEPHDVDMDLILCAGEIIRPGLL